MECGAFDQPEQGIRVRVETDGFGDTYTVCNICEPPG